MARPKSDKRKAVEDYLALRPATMRELCAGLQMSVHDVDDAIRRLRECAAVEVAELRKVDHARRPVAVYRARGTSEQLAAFNLALYGGWLKK